MFFIFRFSFSIFHFSFSIFCFSFSFWVWHSLAMLRIPGPLVAILDFAVDAALQAEIEWPRCHQAGSFSSFSRIFPLRCDLFLFSCRSKYVFILKLIHLNNLFNNVSFLHTTNQSRRNWNNPKHITHYTPICLRPVVYFGKGGHPVDGGWPSFGWWVTTIDGGWPFLGCWVTVLGMVGDLPLEDGWLSGGWWVNVIRMVGDHL